MPTRCPAIRVKAFPMSRDVPLQPAPHGFLRLYADSLTAADRLTSDTVCAPHINENLYIPVTTASKRHNQNNNPKPRHRLIN